MESFLYILFLIIAVLYLLVILACAIAWLSVKQIKSAGDKQFTAKVSVIIAARNEENNISACINDIIKQDYPRGLFEIIIVDDASVDSTTQLVKSIISSTPGTIIKLITLQDDETVVSPKKRALSEAIKIAGGELIVTTDADCRMGSKWLSSLVSFYEQQHPKMIIGPVKFHREENFFQKMQSLEFSGLIGVTGAAAFLHQPVMCNGANLLYEKEAFIQVRGFENNDNQASGDDIFLMLKFKKMFKNQNILFLKSKEAMVHTAAKTTVSEFIHQRKRWASKSLRYRDLSAISMGALVLLFNISIVFSLGLSFFYNKFTELFFIMAVIKCFADFTFLFAVSSFFEKRNLLWMVIPEQLLYTIYVVTIGIAAPFGAYNWKGRKLH